MRFLSDTVAVAERERELESKSERERESERAREQECERAKEREVLTDTVPTG